MMLRVEKLDFVRGGKSILDGVSLQVKPGEFVALIGPNGAGKSTLLRHVAGVFPLPPDRVFLDGRDRSKLAPREAARIVAYVPQAREPANPFTAGEIVRQARYPWLSGWGRGSERDRERVGEAIDRVGIGPLVDRVFSTLSGGEQQKVLLAAAFAQDAKLLLLDEPTTFLDPPRQDEVFRLIDQVCREKGIAMLVVTHDINRAVVAADRIVAIRAGVIVQDGAPEEVATAGTLADLYGGEFLLAPHPENGLPMVLPGIVREEAH